MFQPFEKFVYRLPAFPINQLMKVLDTDKELSEWFVDERIGETVYVGSPDLYKELQKLINGEIKERDKKRKIEASFMKYLSQMSTRCTPFGLFATCSIGKIDDTTQFDITDEISRCTRLDMYHFIFIIRIFIFNFSHKIFSQTIKFRKFDFRISMRNTFVKEQFLKHFSISIAFSTIPRALSPQALQHIYT